MITLLSLSLLVASPLQASAAQTSSSVSSQVVPIVLGGYKAEGPLPGSAQVFVTLGIPLLNQQNLEYLTQQISTPGSSMYHHFLTQQQVQAYLPVAQYQAALAALTSRGLTIVSSSLDSIIVAEGTASQVIAVSRTELRGLLRRV